MSGKGQLDMMQAEILRHVPFSVSLAATVIHTERT